MALGIGSDQWGAQLKYYLTKVLSDYGITVLDFGVNSSDPVDYPDIAQLVAEAVVDKRVSRGVLICKTGLGMAIAANKVPGIRAATVHNIKTARAAAASNNAQIITLGCEDLDPGLACDLVNEWLVTPFKGGPSAEKVSKIQLMELKYLDAGNVQPGV